MIFNLQPLDATATTHLTLRMTCVIDVFISVELYLTVTQFTATLHRAMETG